ncbi:MAG TPA: tetratricopeptide repeat protein [Polyangiaceae bacterium]|nr:tetratricopeptide repeat protein [Polyangiaceae bacterium]
MSGTEDGDKRSRGAGRSGSAGSIGKELGDDLDFEADALLDSLLSDIPPAPKPKSARPGAPSDAPPPSEGPMLHAPASREFPDDEPTWVGNIEAATGLELQALATKMGLEKKPASETIKPAAEVLPPPRPASSATPEIPVLPPPPAFTAPKPAGIPRPGAGTSSVPRPSSGVSSVPRPASRAPTPPRPVPAQQPSRELPTFAEDDEVTRVHGMPTLHDIDGLIERSAQESPPSVMQTARPPAGVQEAHIQTSAAPLEELSLDDDSLPSSSSATAIHSLSELSFEEPQEGIEELLDVAELPSQTYAPGPPAPGAAEIGDGELSEAELEALAAAEEEERRPSAPLSHVPPPPDNRSPQSLWPDERPAASHLALDADRWTERAEWLESEAHAASDPIAKARTLLVASEIWALVGDTARAREVATEASSLARALPLVGRQLRALAAAEQDWKAVVTALDLETRGAPTPEARVHAAYLNAEVHRLALKDDATGKKKLELAVRANVDDPRAHLSKLVDLLSKGTGPARMRWPESVALAELVQATEESSRLRGAPAPAGPAGAPSSTVSPSLALEQARKSFALGERGQSAASVARLAEIDGIGPAALWLAASLAAHEQKTRPDAIGWLERLLGGGADALARRTLAARSLEQGSKQGIASASEGETEAFRALDRAVLGALSGEGIETLGPLALELSQTEAQRPLAAAVHSAVSTAQQGELLAGSASARSAQLLGLSLAPATGSEPAATTPHLRAPTERFVADNPEHPLGGAFGLRFAQSDKQAAALLRGIALLAGGEQARDENLASALVEELSGNGELARARYGAALEADPRSPLALRALLSGADRDGMLRLLTAAAEAGGDPVQSALYLLEAALRLGPEDAERYEELLRKASGVLPSLSLVHRLGEQQARARGDAEQLLSWLRARRAESQDPLETALDLVREALLVAENDLALAASLLNDALAARPNDIALRELHERIAGSSDDDRAAWREQVAEQSGDDTKRELYAQAALEHRRAGNVEATGRAAQAAVQLGGSELTRVLADESATGTGAAARVSEALLSLARATEDPAELSELYERLSKLDRARGDASSALLWQTAILERAPDYLPALRRVEHHYIGANRLEELEPIAARLATLTSGGEADAHARLAARIRIRNGAWPSVRELVSGALTQEPPRLWALRMLEAQARAADDSATTLAVTQKLQERVERPVDKATLLLRSAEAATRLGQLDQAQLMLERALALVPDHQVVLTTLAEVLEARGDFRASARALEALAEASLLDAHKVNAWHQAGVLWLDKGNDTERGRSALENAVALDITNEDAVVRLQALYVSGGDREKLAALLERRLSHTTDPEERVALEVTRGRALADVGERAQAKAALAAALDANPDHVEALSAFAELCSEEGDWNAAEQAYIRLVRHLPEPARQAQIYRKLGELYDTSLPNPERAELAYREVLKRDAEDADAMSRLVQVLGRRGMADKAVELQTEFLGRATTPEAKRSRTLGLALVIEQLAGDRKKAEALLDKARKEAPLDHTVLRALVEMHQRAGEQRAATVLLDRAATDARRALATGRFDPALFEMLAAVAELRGASDAASLATATLMSLTGEDMPVAATGQAAGDARLDDQLAPDLITPALRALLKKAGDLLDAAYAVDLRAIKAAPLPAGAQPFVAFVQNVAQSFGLRGLEVFASPALGPVCMPVSANPPIIVFGQTLLDHSDDAARFFLLMRSLKILQGRAAALSRIPPIELPAVVSAFLSLFAANWTPQGVDAKKLSEAQAKLRQAMRTRLDDDVPVLALEVIGSLGTRVSQLGTALLQWGDRCGLLAVGSPNAALRGLALAAGQLAGPPPGPERVKWVIRNPEARDLAVFSVSEAYADARSRLGVGH